MCGLYEDYITATDDGRRAIILMDNMEEVPVRCVITDVSGGAEHLFFRAVFVTEEGDEVNPDEVQWQWDA